MRLRLIECPPFLTGKEGGPAYKPGDCWYARRGDVHYCRTCGCLWRKWPPNDVQPDGSWSLVGNYEPGPCCDNATMHLGPVYHWWSNHGRPVRPANSAIAPDLAPEHADAVPMMVVLPSGVVHCLQAPTYKDGKPGKSGWVVSGELPDVTVKPSINWGHPSMPHHWHGYITNGEMR